MRLYKQLARTAARTARTEFAPAVYHCIQMVPYWVTLWDVDGSRTLKQWIALKSANECRAIARRVRVYGDNIATALRTSDDYKSAISLGLYNMPDANLWKQLRT